jgi:hypothetical protein
MLGREQEAESDYRAVLDKSATRANLAILSRARAQGQQSAEKPAIGEGNSGIAQSSSSESNPAGTVSE